MYSDELFLGITLYDIFLYGGLIAALILFDRFSGKKGMSVGAQRFYLILTILSMAFGLFTATLFQGFYNFFATGRFFFEGMTFLGGLIGGAGLFIAAVFTVGKKYKSEFYIVLQVAPCCITAAHCLGRIGCFFAGCCYGIETDSFLGMHFPHLNGYASTDGIKVLPTNLYEAIFLAGLFAVTVWLCLKKPKWNMPVYVTAYGVFRFIIEFFRGDDGERGKFLLPFLSPSQHFALLMAIGGAVWIILLALGKIGRPKSTEPQDTAGIGASAVMPTPDKNQGGEDTQNGEGTDKK